MDIDDITLHAWFDGELPPEQAVGVEAHLRDSPDLAAQVRLWRADAMRCACSSTRCCWNRCHRS